MSENSFENSTFSETNSGAEDLSASNLNTSPMSLMPEATTEFCTSSMIALSVQDTLTSLPVNLMQHQQQQETTTTTTTTKSTTIVQNPIFDAELVDLLTRKKTVIQTQAPKCAKCEKSVYKAEEIRAANKTFHNLCFKCTTCNKLLEAKILSEHHGDLYCKNCYGKNFGPKGYGFGVGAGIMSATEPTPTPPSGSPSSQANSPLSTTTVNPTSTLKPTYSTLKTENNNQPSDTITASVIYSTTNTAITTNNNNVNVINRNLNTTPLNGEKRGSITAKVYGSSDKCARCTKSVYAAEKVNAANKAYHKLCFTCATCKKSLSSMNCCDNSDGEVFCKACYGKQYGPKGVGYGVGAGTLQAN